MTSGPSAVQCYLVLLLDSARVVKCLIVGCFEKKNFLIPMLLYVIIIIIIIIIIIYLFYTKYGKQDNKYIE